MGEFKPEEGLGEVCGRVIAEDLEGDPGVWGI